MGEMTLSARSIAMATIVALSIATLSLEAVAETGRASWYALTSRTASGERCNPKAMTAAHPSLPFGTKVQVENLRNGRSVVVRINDRGPYVAGRVIDLTKAAAAALGFVERGIAKVRLTVLSTG
jgi:rare lipoprotein A